MYASDWRTAVARFIEQTLEGARWTARKGGAEVVVFVRRAAPPFRRVRRALAGVGWPSDAHPTRRPPDAGDAKSVDRVRAPVVNAAVILVGDELLAGHTRDANGHFLAQRLTVLGHRVRRITIIPDENHALHDEVNRCLQLAEVTLLCGGLGPTHDDRTSESLAERWGRPLVVDEPSWDRMLKRYGDRVKLTPDVVESAKKMVMVPQGAEVLENPVGAAIGYVLREGVSALVVMPGVPAEMQAMFEQHVVGRILPAGSPTSLVEVDVELPEAVFARDLSDVARAFGDVEIGSYPHYGEKRVTLRFRGEPARAAAAMESFFERQPAARRK